jgi:hypothetical protein
MHNNVLGAGLWQEEKGTVPSSNNKHCEGQRSKQSSNPYYCSTPHSRGVMSSQGFPNIMKPRNQLPLWTCKKYEKQ